MSDQNDPNIGKMAVNENEQLGMIVDKTRLGDVTVYIGIPVSSDLHWLSINPKVFKDKVDANSVMEMAVHSARGQMKSASPPAPKKEGGERYDTFFTVNPGESIGEALDSFLNSFPLNPKKPPSPEDFRIDSIDSTDEDPQQ